MQYSPLPPPSLCRLTVIPPLGINEFWFWEGLRVGEGLHSTSCFCVHAGEEDIIDGGFGQSGKFKVWALSAVGAYPLHLRCMHYHDTHRYMHYYVYIPGLCITMFIFQAYVLLRIPVGVSITYCPQVYVSLCLSPRYMYCYVYPQVCVLLCIPPRPMHYYVYLSGLCITVYISQADALLCIPASVRITV